MSSKITTIISFKIESTFEEWVKIFDSKEADLRHTEFDIKPLFRGFSKDDPKKVICINQAQEGNIQEFVQANSCLLYTSPSPRDDELSRMPSSA